jgi:hypothetical protein
MTTAESLTTESILDTLATAERVLPRAALRHAAEHWDEVGPALIARLEAAAAGAELTEYDDNILFYTIYLAAQVRETRAFRPLLAIAADHEKIDWILGDGITENLSAILARLYDGDPAPLRALIENADADEFVRNAALGTVLVLTASGRISRDDTAAYLRHLYATLQPQGECWVWVGWQQAIAALCLDDLVPLVEDAFARGFIGDHVMSLKHFHEDLEKARQAADPATAFDSAVRDDGRFDDLVALMSDWACFQPEKKAARTAAPVRMGAETVRNPYRNVGRNDPCPCGSGKKFKKCCLETVREISRPIQAA